MSKFNDYFKSLKGKTVDVIGIGVSNRPLIKKLAQSGANVCAFDKNKDTDIKEFEGLDITFHLGDDYLEKLSSEIIFRTPGMHPSNIYLQKAIENGSKITSEVEVFFDVCPCKIIAITGSDGKTTTTTLVSEILKNAGKTVHLGGNIGRPLLCDVPFMSENDFCVVELSSFQLQTMKKSASIAVITNITPNHLDIHRDMEEYIEAKKNVYLNQGNDDTIVINLDDEISKDFKSNGKIVYFSMHKHSKEGAYLDNDDIVLNTGTERKILMKKSDILLKGDHNVANYLTAICATYKLIDALTIKEVAKTFGGVSHRIEFVREFEGVKYYNDSIATSPTRAIAGLKAFDEKIILIAGGYDKKLDYAPLGKVAKDTVKKMVLVGATSKLIYDAVTEFTSDVEIYECKEFKEAILKAREIASCGDIVILSPASASFDLFKNFAERGDLFKNIVKEFK